MALTMGVARLFGQALAGRIDYSTHETNYTLALATLSGQLRRRSLIVVFTAINPGFMSLRNMARIAIASTPPLMVAIGVTFIIIMAVIITMPRG